MTTIAGQLFDTSLGKRC